MIHPENADEAVDRLLMLIGDLGVGLADLASSAVTQDKAALIERFAALGQLGADVAALAEAGKVVLTNRFEQSAERSF
ncbi:hypothetical protein [Brevundimonas sp. TWP2-3-4b2]|uniref:hypothetical protein n=1 Tax=Brevundimonas sp. TWP2-3-4b2 TaxID=2804595 RepID=UPI003CF434D3